MRLVAKDRTSPTHGGMKLLHVAMPTIMVVREGRAKYAALQREIQDRGCATWLAICGNGFKMSGTTITAERRQMEARGVKVVIVCIMALTGSYVAAAGPTTRRAYALPTAATAARPTRTATLARAYPVLSPEYLNT